MGKRGHTLFPHFRRQSVAARRRKTINQLRSNILNRLYANKTGGPEDVAARRRPLERPILIYISTVPAEHSRKRAAETPPSTIHPGCPIMNSSTDDPESHWREKYLKLLSAGESHQLEQEEKEQLLSRAVIRLTFAASGLDPALNPHLQAIRDVMRKELKTADLRRQLDALMDALIRIPASDNSDAAQATGSGLLRFLQSPQLGYPDEKAVATLQQRIESGSFTGEDQLFSAVAKLLKQPREENKGLFGRMLGTGNRAQGGADEGKLRKPLESLLKALNVPVALEKRRNQLVDRVQQGDEDLIALLDASAALITETSEETGKEQQALNDFLAVLSAKLGELEEKTLGLDTLDKQSMESWRSHDQLVGDELTGLRSEAREASDLMKLKEIVETRLDFVTSQLEAHKNAEEVRFAESQKHLQEVSLRLRTLEQESDDLRTKLNHAHNFALTDPLTRLPNRAAYIERVELEEKRWRRFRQPITLLIWDIDFFKKINDRFGHSSGDKALGFIARLLISSVRATDFVARYGGEEFAMLLVGSDESNALDVAQEIRRRVESCEFTTMGKPVDITMSCGISQFKGQDTYEDVFERADKALYQAKRKGRNRCELAPANL